MKSLLLTAIFSYLMVACVAIPSLRADDPPANKLPEPGTVVIDSTKSEVILSAKVQFPEDKPCINDFGQRVQAFAGCAPELNELLRGFQVVLGQSP